MEKLFWLFISKWRLAMTLTAMILIVGVIGLFKLNRESFPPVSFQMGIITTIYPGASSVDVNDNVTQVIEEEIRTVDGVKDVNATSQSGRSSIIVRLDMDNPDADTAMDDLESAINKVRKLPEGVLESPRFAEPKSTELPILRLALTGDNDNRLRDHWADKIKEIFETYDDVARVVLTGFNEAELQVLLNPNKLNALHVGIPEVVNAVKKRVQDVPAGFIKNRKEQKLVRVVGKTTKPHEIENIVVRSNFDGRNIKIKDIGRVIYTNEDPLVISTYNSKPATLVVIQKKEKADAIKTLRILKPKIEEIRKELPQGYTLEEYDNEAKRVKDRLSIVVGNAISGMILVIILLFIFLPKSVAFVTSMSLPIAVLATVGIMPFLGVNFNTVTMLALVIAIGMLVDNAIVISENYTRLRIDGNSPEEAAFKGVKQFWLPITATAFTTIAAFMPMLVTKGIMGQFIRYIPIVVCIALSISLLESFVLLPARLRFTIRDTEKNKHALEAGDFFTKFQKLFERFVKVCIRRRYITFFVISSALVLSMVSSAVFNHFDLFPREDVEFYVSRYELPLNATLEETQAKGKVLATELREKLGADKVKYAIVTAGESKVDVMDGAAKYGDNVGLIRLAIPIEAAKKQKAEEILKDMRSIDISSFETVTFEALAPGPPVGKALELTLSDPGFETLKMAVDELKNELKDIKGVMDVADNNNPGAPEITFDIDQELLSSLKLSIEDVGVVLRSALQGAIASYVNIDNDDVAVRVRFDEEFRFDASNLNSIRLMDNMGNLIPLTRVATIKKTDGPPIYKRYNFARTISVSADVDNENITSTGLNSKAEKIIKKLQIKYPNLKSHYLGQAESTKESIESLKNAMIIAVFCIILILVFLFDSFIKPFIVITTIPLGLIGVSLSFILHGKPISFFALIGVVGLAGVVVNSAIVLISFIDDLHEQKPEAPLEDLLAEATSLRLRAVTVTTLTTVGGLLPTAYGLGGYDPILVPLTLALAWGLVSGTMVTLIWVPCCVAILTDLGLSKRLKPTVKNV